jgi:hypothetical protein
VRTWDQNRAAINQLWPMAQFTDEEKRLWNEDLCRLDQVVLYDAIRNVKRTRDSLYPQLTWVMTEYRDLMRVRRATERKPAGERHTPVVIDRDSDQQVGRDLRAVVEMATRETYGETVDMIADAAGRLKIEMKTAYGLVLYLLKRLGMDRGNALGGEA